MRPRRVYTARRIRGEHREHRHGASPYIHVTSALAVVSVISNEVILSGHFGRRQKRLGSDCRLRAWSTISVKSAHANTSPPPHAPRLPARVGTDPAFERGHR